MTARACVFLLWGLVACWARADDWPQWRGPNRDGRSAETGLLDRWPSEGPEQVAVLGGLGGGFSSMAVVEGVLYTQGYFGSEERVVAVDIGTGQRRWSTPLGPAEQVGYAGSRSTPTVDGARVYCLGVAGDLVCLDRRTGSPVWRRNLRKDWGGQPGGWGYAESPLVDGDAVVVTPGGTRATLVKLQKQTGQEIWTTLIRASGKSKNEGHPEQAAYASIVLLRASGRKQYVQFLAGAVVGVDTQKGTLLWRYDRPANRTANIATPVVWRDYVMASSAYEAGTGLVRILAQHRGQPTLREVYFTRELKNHHGGVVWHTGYIYGCDGSIWTCLRFEDGKPQWKDRGVGKGSLIYADGKLICFSEGGVVGLVEAVPEKYRELGRFRLPALSGQPTWAHPALADGVLYLRDWDQVYLYRVSRKPSHP
jgi:outer membrane protein assembly factor BamB